MTQKPASIVRTLIITSPGERVTVPGSIFHQLPAMPTPDRADEGVVFFTVVGIFLFVIVVPLLYHRTRKNTCVSNHKKKAAVALKVNFIEYDALLAGYNVYYKTLTPTM